MEEAKIFSNREMEEIFSKRVDSSVPDIGDTTLFRRIIEQIAAVNKELWIILTMVSIAGIMNYVVTSQYMILGFYTFPTIMSAYYYGRRHAVMTALLTLIIVGCMTYFKPTIFSGTTQLSLEYNTWYHVMAWGSTLLLTAYAMGSLYERHQQKTEELRETYYGIIMILRHFIAKDQYTENHCYRVSIYATKIASYMGLPQDFIEDIRAAALLHDIGKLEISRDILYKAAKLTKEEFNHMKRHVPKGELLLEPVRGPLNRILPIILAHHERWDGSGYMGLKGRDIVLGARIVAVADVYDALVSDRPYKKGLPPFEAKEFIEKGAGKEFDPKVVEAFLTAFRRGELDVPNVVV